MLSLKTLDFLSNLLLVNLVTAVWTLDFFVFLENTPDLFSKRSSFRIGCEFLTCERASLACDRAIRLSWFNLFDLALECAVPTLVADFEV